MQGLPKSIRTGCRKVINHRLVLPSPAVACHATEWETAEDLCNAGCHIKVYVLASGHIRSGCIFLCMWVKGERKGSPSFPVTLHPFLYCFLPAFTVFRDRCNTVWLPSGESSQLLCTDINWDTRTRWRKKGQYQVGLCPTYWKLPALQALALLFYMERDDLC